MKYLLDFDRTLFDVEKLYAQLDSCGHRHLAGTQESLAYVSPVELLFSDVADFFSSVDKADVFVVSSVSGLSAQWDTEYQMAKILASGIGALVHDVRVVKGEKGAEAIQIASLFPVEETIVFVDDRIENCLAVQAVLPNAHCFHLVRESKNLEISRENKGISVVHTLSELSDIIGSL